MGKLISERILNQVNHSGSQQISSQKGNKIRPSQIVFPVNDILSRTSELIEFFRPFNWIHGQKQKSIAKGKYQKCYECLHNFGTLSQRYGLPLKAPKS